MIYLASVLVGLSFGSFANVCIYRLPQNKSISHPHSYCPACHTPLRWQDNIPLFSFLVLRGRCHHCHKPISWQYPLVEAAMALLFLISTWRFPYAYFQILICDILAFYLLTLSVIDARHKIIPDEFSVSLLAIGLLLSWHNPWLQGHALHPALESALAAITGGLLMILFAWVGERIFKKEAMGGGDIKLMAAFGALLGWGGLIGPLLIGSTLGALFGGTLLLLKRKKMGETIPFGPFLSVGAYLTCLFPAWWSFFLSP